jgi:O-antigen ligase
MRTTKSASALTAISWVVPIVAFASILLVDAVTSRPDGFLSQLFKDLEHLCWDSQQQWMLYACLMMYFVILLVQVNRDGKPRFSSLNNPHLWLAVTMAIGSIAYGLQYSEAARPPQALVFLFGPVLGLGALAATRLWRERQRSLCPLLCSLTGILFICSVWKRDSGFKSNYLGQQRWSGPWNNPNLFGLLVGVGLVLLLGIGFSFVGHCKPQGAKTESTQRTKLRSWTLILLWLGMAVVMSLASLRSYSRGAWVATGCVLTFLIGSWLWRLGSGGETSKAESGKRKAETLCSLWFKNNWLSVGIILFSVVALSFWHFRQTEWHPARRALSAVNTVDFSWRNRIVAWEGALQMMADRPLLGFAWNQPEPLYEHYYLPPKSTESAAIQMNDYLMLGATLGIPALFCFGMYLWLSLTGKAESRKQKAEIESQDLKSDLWPPASDFLSATCRAGAIVLLVGFWFDGGLFELPTASTFWTLLELGRADLVQQKATEETKMHPIVA